MKPENISLNNRIPLAERLRPQNLDDYIGQEHIVGKGAILRKAIESGNIPSLIFWGPPGVGKTTLALIIAQQLKRKLFTLSAISSGVKDVRQVIGHASENSDGAILFIDEIHRLHKSQQDSLLGAVEKGIITLIGATTENPSFEVISPLLSRCQVYILKDFSKEHLLFLLEKAKAHYLKTENHIITITENEALLRVSGRDARKLLNAAEQVVQTHHINKEMIITNDMVQEVIQKNLATYDKSGQKSS